MTVARHASGTHTLAVGSSRSLRGLFSGEERVRDIAKLKSVFVYGLRICKGHGALCQGLARGSLCQWVSVCRPTTQGVALSVVSVMPSGRDKIATLEPGAASKHAPGHPMRRGTSRQSCPTRARPRCCQDVDFDLPVGILASRKAFVHRHPGCC